MRYVSLLGAAIVLLGTTACSGSGDAGPAMEVDQAKHMPTAADAFRPAVEKPPKGWTGPVFALSHDYPSKLPDPPKGGFPWEQHDFKNDPAAYIQSLLDYARADLEAVDWQPTKLTKPNWFHSPWMATGKPSGTGREFIHGMTQERSSLPGELSPQQKTKYIQNYAVGIYNDRGGYTFGQVWADPVKPDAAKSRFKNGTMAIKLLFTEADPNKPDDGVPFLKGSKKWQASVAKYGSGDRKPKTLRLLQVDVAVRDKRNDDLAGWVFGTFTFDGNAKGSGHFDRLRPVGLAWGDNEGVTPEDVASGKKKLDQQWINTELGLYEHLGWAGRLNGPVDNPVSSCISCHGLSETPLLTSLTPPPGTSVKDRLKWFENIPAGTAKDASKGAVSLDYSLQMASAFRGLAQSTPGAKSLAELGEHPVHRGSEDSR